MAVITNRELEHLPVFTESGTPLGHVKAWEMGTETHSILRYLVKPSGIARMLAERALLIPPAAVIRITRERMVVRDSVEGEAVTPFRMEALPMKAPVPALTRAEE